MSAQVVWSTFTPVPVRLKFKVDHKGLTEPVAVKVFKKVEVDSRSVCRPEKKVVESLLIWGTVPPQPQPTELKLTEFPYTRFPVAKSPPFQVTEPPTIRLSVAGVVQLSLSPIV